jgi:hypothetical protein
VDKLCAEGETVDLRILPGIAYPDSGQVAVPEVVRWIADRFARNRRSSRQRMTRVGTSGHASSGKGSDSLASHCLRPLFSAWAARSGGTSW